MDKMQVQYDSRAALVVEYTDALEGFKGWLVIAHLNYALCAGGMRVQKGLTKEHVCRMAGNMSKKMKICRLPIDGAKCGIDYDPAAPGKKAAMARFMGAIKPYIESRYSMGPDLNTDMEELEAIARALGIPSVKMAVAQAQKISLDSFQERYALLAAEVYSDWSLGKVRAGHGVASAALATLEFLQIPCDRATVALQGFGNLAKATALGLMEAGVKIIAVADAEKCIQAKSGAALDMTSLLKTEGTLLPETRKDPDLATLDSSALFATECDILLLAAIENAITTENAARLRCRAVVPGANLAVSQEAEELLHRQGILVLPCFLAGCGGSLSMNGLFGPEKAPAAKDVLNFVGRQIKEITLQILQESRGRQTTPTETAEQLCRDAVAIARDKPYAV
jgi:glutamate dehydrogenase (NAD(P)+)